MHILGPNTNFLNIFEVASSVDTNVAYWWYCTRDSGGLRLHTVQCNLPFKLKPDDAQYSIMRRTDTKLLSKSISRWKRNKRAMTRVLLAPFFFASRSIDEIPANTAKCQPAQTEWGRLLISKLLPKPNALSTKHIRPDLWVFGGPSSELVTFMRDVSNRFRPSLPYPPQDRQKLISPSLSYTKRYCINHRFSFILSIL